MGLVMRMESWAKYFLLSFSTASPHCFNSIKVYRLYYVLLRLLHPIIAQIYMESLI